MQWTTGSVVIVLAAPWIGMALYGLYFGIFLRPKVLEAHSLSPLLTFLFFLTDGATPGYDQRLMQLFHPDLFKEGGGGVQRGLIRAMSRCLLEAFGKPVHIARNTVVIKRNGLQSNCMALVDFERAKGVRCQLSWERRPGALKKYRFNNGHYPKREGKEAFTVNGISIAFPHTFWVTAFHVDPKPDDAFDVLAYVDVKDFDGFGELFVGRLLQAPPADAVGMMVESLQQKYAGEKVKKLEDAVQSVVTACGGLVERLADLTVTQMSCKAVYTSPATADDLSAAQRIPGERVDLLEEKKPKAIDGVDMEYLIRCHNRNMVAVLRVTFSGIKAAICRYELQALPDERIQVVMDQDEGGACTLVA